MTGPGIAWPSALALLLSQPALAATAAPAATEPAALGPTLLVALVFAAIHLLGRALTFLRTTPRSVWLSAAGGISVAYVFVHILPEFAHHQHEFDLRGGPLGLLDTSERHVYFVALVGLAAFYGLDSLARASARGLGRGHRPSRHVFWIHLAAYAAFNVLIGYLLLHREEPGLYGLLTYAVAMAMHFVVADQSLRRQFSPAYDGIGRWLLAAAPLLGWALGATLAVAPLAVAAMFAFLAGGIVLSVLKEELPEEHESHFWAFALGTGLYAALLLATD
jgi:hypothetical protein